MSDFIEVSIKSGRNQKTNFKIHKDASVEELMRKISQWNGVDAESQRVLYTGYKLQMEKNGKKMCLSDYKVEDRSILFVVFTLVGGTGPDTPEEAPRKWLDDDVELSNLPDMITWDDDPDNQRAKMPCGHAIGPESLTAYCRSLMTAGKWQFPCPYIDKETGYCGQLWEYYVIRRLGVLTAEERKFFETKTSENYLRKSGGIQECPKCTAFCSRKKSKDRRLMCLFCSKNGERYEFCWNCLGKWNSPGSSNCGNDACTGEDPRLKILRDAKRKEIVGLQGCPSIRACPKCGILIQHIKACKQMKCVCDQRFCFICLKKASDSGIYPCGAYNSHCNIAPIQTNIDGDDNGNNDHDKQDSSWGCVIM